MLEPNSRTGSPRIGPPGALDASILDITGMVCTGCAAGIRNRLLASTGILSVDVDLTRATARVLFMPERVLYRDLTEAVSGMGGNAHNRLEATVIV